ncbi:hypothetical protein F4Y93_03920 [Candidatus Poribacteria bacterium]|nr:hypothetical protein [Candidatus Poribacteria bacterium]
MQFSILDISTVATVIIALVSMLIKQWSSDRKMFAMLKTMETRQDFFQSTIDKICQHLEDSIKDHAVLMDRTKGEK